MSRLSAGLRDWIFSAPLKRGVLEYVLDPDHERLVMTERQLAEELGAHPSGSVGTHLNALAQLGLLRRSPSPRRFTILPAEERGETAEQIRQALVALLEALRRLPDEEMDRSK